MNQQPRAVRHAEKRRTSTCSFADRIAHVSVEHYQKVVPWSFRHKQKQTCVATILAHDCVTKELRVVAMGVGTKFLSNSTLAEETASPTNYGDRVRDCHAEVLARRAFRRFLSLQILYDSKQDASCAKDDTFSMILEKADFGNPKNPSLYKLKPHITVHCYSSSAPCGNAVLKRFAACRKEVFQDELGPDEWPVSNHDEISGHAMSQGEFALLLKEDKSHIISPEDRIALEKRKLLLLNPKQRSWPSNCQTDWCPAGTTTVFSGNGSLHTCSDKLLRWNILGWQGSLLSSSFLTGGIVPETLTVGRKLSAITCRRAVCCRAVGTNARKRHRRSRPREATEGTQGSNHSISLSQTEMISDEILQKHPVILGTSVYLDDDGVIETDPSNPGQDVRFHSSLSFAWWLGADVYNISTNSTALTIDGGSLECIDGATGWAMKPTVVDNEKRNWEEVIHFNGKIVTENMDLCQDGPAKLVSLVSTAALTDFFLSIRLPCPSPISVDEYKVDDSNRTLTKLRQIKLFYGEEYERRKATYFAEHEVLRLWNRRLQVDPRRNYEE